MTITAKNNIIIAKKIVDSIKNEVNNGLIFIKDEIPIYEIISVGKNTNFSIGDKIICSSIGSCIDKKNKLYMFENYKIIGKINE